MVDASQQRDMLASQRHKVDFDTYDVTVDELVRRVGKSRIEIAPVYQRRFRWGELRQSQLIESLYLGIPIPPLFMATNSNPGETVKWEVVDGLQRLLTLVNFIGDKDTRTTARLLGEPLCLTPLEKLSTFGSFQFKDLPEDLQNALEDRPIKVVVLNDKSDLDVRFDLFERLNTGGIALTDQEVRECVYRGKFMDFLSECADTSNFKQVIKLPRYKWKDGSPEDYVLRFFAFHERYRSFDHSVKDFLNSFAAASVNFPNLKDRKTTFDKTFDFLAPLFPNGLTTRKGMTPVNLFEAITVGAALALDDCTHLGKPETMSWVTSDQLRHLTTGATNSRPRVRGRIEFCRDRFRVSQNV